MIPDVRVRQIRDCEECVFFNTEEEFCTLYEDSIQAEKIERWEYNDPSRSCVYHFSVDEIMELIQISLRSDQNGTSVKMWMAQ